jgi:hypothetical protein
VFKVCLISRADKVFENIQGTRKVWTEHVVACTATDMHGCEIGEYTTTASELWLGKHFPAETNTHVTVDLLWKRGVFCVVWPKCYEQESLKKPVDLSSAREAEKIWPYS